jgi:signal peptidase I
MVNKKGVGKKSEENYLKQFWNFIWNGESLLSWVAFIFFAFIIIKFIFFPVLSFITGTSLPLVIVESCSMYHGTNFDNWWEIKGGWYEERGITKEEFSEFRFKNGFNKGDIFFILGIKKDKIEIGDTIIFWSAGKPIIHRVVNLEPLATKGDNNPGFLKNNNGNNEGIDETNIREEEIVGKATLVRIPYLGWVKLIFYEPFRDSSQRGLCKLNS